MRGRGVTLPVVCGAVEDHRCRHVEQGPGLADQVTGGVVVDDDTGLEARHDLEHTEHDSDLLAGVICVLLVGEPDGLCRRAELIIDIVYHK